MAISMLASSYTVSTYLSTASRALNALTQLPAFCYNNDTNLK